MDRLLVVLGQLFVWAPVLYTVLWFVVCAILFAWTFSKPEMAGKVLGFMALGLVPLVLWRWFK